ncbi:MAG TPA: TMEM175 family protein, partial [Calditrichia bacterium]|nr:TMEM175 family protein [Calditrichia bacterium]
MALIRNRNEVSRLEAFSDAVFGFSATLLVVSLQVPATFDELILELKGFGAFGISFGALVLIWSVHNAFFRRYGLQDTAT